MSSEDVRPRTDTGLQVAPWRQVLVSCSSLDSPYEHLPAVAGERLLVVSPNAPDDVAEDLESAGIDPSAVAMVPVSGTEVTSDGRVRLTEAVVPDDLTGLSMRCSALIEALGSGGWVVFDQVNVLLLYAEENRVVKFLDHVAGTMRDAEIRGLFCVDREAIDDRTYETLRRRVDTESDLR